MGVFFCLFLLLFSVSSLHAFEKGLFWVNQVVGDVFKKLPEHRGSIPEVINNVFDDPLFIYPFDISIVVSEEELIKTIDAFIEQKRKMLCDKVEQKKMYFQKVAASCGARALVVGDIHGSAHSLGRNVLRWINEGYMDSSGELREGIYLLWTGDAADRGHYGVEVWYILMNLWLKNPDQVFFVKGNHETKELAERYGFKAELLARYGEEKGAELAEKMYDVFDLLPEMVCWGVEDNFIMLVHGGLPTMLEFTLEMCDDTQVITNISHFVLQEEVYKLLKAEERIAYLQVDNSYGANWNDFITGMDISFSERGNNISKIGIDIVANGLKEYGVKVIFRGHQHNPHAVSFFSSQQGSMWQKIGHKSTSLLEEHPVYSFMSCPEGVGGTGDDFYYCNVDGYGVLETDCDDFQYWFLAAHEYLLPEDRHNKYVHCPFLQGEKK